MVKMCIYFIRRYVSIFVYVYEYKKVPPLVYLGRVRDVLEF